MLLVYFGHVLSTMQNWDRNWDKVNWGYPRGSVTAHRWKENNTPPNHLPAGLLQYGCKALCRRMGRNQLERLSETAWVVTELRMRAAECSPRNEPSLKRRDGHVKIWISVEHCPPAMTGLPHKVSVALITCMRSGKTGQSTSVMEGQT